MVGEPVAGVLVGGRRDRVQALDDRVQALGDRVFFSLVEVLDFSLNDLCFPLEGPRLSSLLPS